MSNISQAEKNLKKKLSLNDYNQPDGASEQAQNSVQTDVGPSKSPEIVQSKIKATYYLSQDDHAALTQVYIKRLQDRQKTDRSALVSEAIRLLYKQEMER